MRRWILVLCLIGFVSNVSDAVAGEFDVPTLRGSSPFIPAAPKHFRWSGFYGGGQIGLAAGNMNFADAFDSLNIFDSVNQFTAPLGRVSTWATLGRSTPTSTSYGGFVGYNTQWSDALVGFEFNYNRMSLHGSASDSRCYSDTDPQCQPPRTLGDPAVDYNVTIDARATARITDYGTVRARGGWIYQNMMAYGLIGVAVARVQTARMATASFSPDPPAPVTNPYVETDSRMRYTWGYAFGGGVDFMIMPHMFVRAEYEFIRLNPVADIRMSVSTARFGAGVKF